MKLWQRIIGTGCELERADRRAFLRGMMVTSAGLLVVRPKIFLPSRPREFVGGVDSGSDATAYMVMRKSANGEVTIVYPAGPPPWSFEVEINGERHRWTSLSDLAVRGV